MRKPEFSKVVLCLVMLTYFAALVFGMVVIYKMSDCNSAYTATAICGLFSFVAAPVAVTIGFYSNKAKAENIEKIKRCEELIAMHGENGHGDSKIINEENADA